MDDARNSKAPTPHPSPGHRIVDRTELNRTENQNHMTLERDTPTRASRAPAGSFRSRSENRVGAFGLRRRLCSFLAALRSSKSTAFVLSFSRRQRPASQHSMLLAARLRRPLKNVQGCGRGRENSGFDGQKRGAPGRECQSSHWLAI